jgi:hypothetical protein
LKWFLNNTVKDWENPFGANRRMFEQNKTFSFFEKIQGNSSNMTDIDTKFLII